MSSYRIIFRQPYKGDSPSRHLTYSRVLYIDRRMVVIDKQAGMVTQLGRSQLQEDQVRLLELDQVSSSDSVKSETLYPVHRLDKGTTGCLALARSRDMARELSQQFQRHAIEKTYYALVRGGEKSFRERQGSINNPIDVAGDGRVCLGAPTDSRGSLTKWELLSSSPSLPLSLLRLRLLTGHKHQLRVHAAKVLQTPILGDNMHSQSRPKKEIQSLLQSLAIPEDRLFLHSSFIGVIRHAKNGRQFRLGIQAPLPHDFVQLCNHSGIELDSKIAEPGLSVDGLSIPDGKIPELNGQILSRLL